MDAEKQEGQKTVVAFITGLLIGGLLVWVFSSTPDTVPQTDNETATTTQGMDNDSDENDDEDDEATVSNDVDVSDDGEGSLDVEDQKAGNTVTIDDVTYPSAEGWVVVRDYANGEQGKILGAVRYSTKAGLAPTSVPLLRSTVKGNTYQVQFYSDNGDMKFGTPADKAIGGGEVTFEAE